MNEITVVLSYLINVGPYVVAAVLLALGLVGFSPWIWKNPAKWLFWFIFALSFSPAGGDAAADGSLFRQLAWGLLFALVAAMLFFDRHTLPVPLFQLVPKSMLLLTGFIFVTIAWSPEPFISFKRASQFLGVLLIAILLARSTLQGADILSHVHKPSGVFIAIGLLAAILTPSIAFDADHALRAISSHKNTWGQFSLLASLVFLFAWIGSQRGVWLLLLGLLPAVTSLVLSRSTTSLLSFLLIAGMLGIWVALTNKSILGKLLLIGLVLSAALAFHGYLLFTGEWPLDALAETIFKATGKSSTLTGRTYLWELMYAEISKHPWLGTGYGGFWTNTAGPSATLTSRLNWGPPTQAHSGYIDVINELGIVGALLLTGVIFSHATTIWRLLRSRHATAGMLHGSILVSALIINYAESSLLRTTHFWWILLCLSVLVAHVLLLVQPEAKGSAAPSPVALTARRMTSWA